MPSTFLLPVTGLSLHSDWTLGKVTLHGQTEGQARVEEWRRKEEGSAGRPLEPQFADILQGRAHVTVAAVQFAQPTASVSPIKDTLGVAVDAVTDALDVLRVFQFERSGTQTTMFGLPGEVRVSRLEFLAAEGERAEPAIFAWGFRDDGDMTGSVFDDDAKASFNGTPLVRVAELVGADVLLEGPGKARLGTRLLSQAIREHRPSMKTLNIVMAVEALLGPLPPLRLTQHTMALTCGPPSDATCGRRGPACAYLVADLQYKPELRAIKALNTNPGTYVCSEWFSFLDRYGARSGVAHGDAGIVVSQQEAEQDLYWAIKRLAFPAITWLFEHPDDPTAALRRDIDARPVALEATKILGREAIAATEKTADH